MAKILAVGGGSGGHVTPVVAVFRELQKTGDHELRFWCDKKFGASARGIFAKFDENIPVDLISYMEPRIAETGITIKDISHTNFRAFVVRMYLEIFSKIRYVRKKEKY